jgi:hypothetical protein
MIAVQSVLFTGPLPETCAKITLTLIVIYIDDIVREGRVNDLGANFLDLPVNEPGFPHVELAFTLTSQNEYCAGEAC